MRGRRDGAASNVASGRRVDDFQPLIGDKVGQNVTPEPSGCEQLTGIVVRISSINLRNARWREWKHPVAPVGVKR